LVEIDRCGIERTAVYGQDSWNVALHVVTHRARNATIPP
jgi:hypothetical protein